MTRPLLWQDLSRAGLTALRDRGALVVIPVGATEQHADHLPVETDTWLAREVTARAAARVSALPVVVGPALPFGFSPHHLSWPGTISLRLETYLALLGDLARSVLDAGFARVLFVNGHGGNEAPLRALCTQMVTDGRAVGMVNYFNPAEPDWVAALSGGLPRAGHACEYETALAMALDPARADGIAAAAAGLAPRCTQPWMVGDGPDDPITAGRAGWPPVFQADDCGYYGDPAAATPAGGVAMLEATVAGLAAFFEAFARAPLRLGVTRQGEPPRLAPPML
ncbi:creatininase family protein [Frigidibacter sp. MR17.14]|uniref:creatininase family protein n=1 Tax=Frigidibacter sp. MR17.14 TaxID=3126509 RepID=UPI003012D06E